MAKESEKTIELQKIEFKYIIEEYILKLLGLSGYKTSEITNKDGNLKNQMIYYDNTNHKIYFKAKKDSKDIRYSVSAPKWVDGFKFEAETIVLKKILSCSNNLSLDKIFNSFFEKCKDHLYTTSLQLGLCKYLFPTNQDDKDNDLNILINELEKWSKKTYEGKKVPFAFVIDKYVSSNMKKYKYFLENDFCAPISDGITSMIELDSECNFVKFKSICTPNGIASTTYNKRIVPLRFSQVICNCVNGQRVGIFLLINGDILLVKEKNFFVKRNGRWLNFSSDRFINILSNVTKYTGPSSPIPLYNAIYSTILDVSFAHTGGIITIVNYSKLKKNNILSVVDDLQIFKTYKDLFKLYVEEQTNKKEKQNIKISDLEKDFEKLYKKRQFIKSLLPVPTKVLFSDIDQKLRSELCSLDGATIIDSDGYVVAFGAIIQNNSGSTGGGRTSAARKLSEFGNFAVKISTDGYIELYSNKTNYSLK